MTGKKYWFDANGEFALRVSAAPQSRLSIASMFSNCAMLQLNRDRVYKVLNKVGTHFAPCAAVIYMMAAIPPTNQILPDGISLRSIGLVATADGRTIEILAALLVGYMNGECRYSVRVCRKRSNGEAVWSRLINKRGNELFVIDGEEPSEIGRSGFSQIVENAQFACWEGEQPGVQAALKERSKEARRKMLAAGSSYVIVSQSPTVK